MHLAIKNLFQFDRYKFLLQGLQSWFLIADMKFVLAPIGS